ncbi:MAG: hypothetical protein ACPIOQ_22805 [Promethearchaeia archaeon]
MEAMADVQRGGMLNMPPSSSLLLIAEGTFSFFWILKFERASNTAFPARSLAKVGAGWPPLPKALGASRL